MERPSAMVDKCLLDRDNSSESVDAKSQKKFKQEFQQNELEYEASSDTPSLVDASDCDDIQSQASGTSSIFSTAHDLQINHLQQIDSEQEKNLYDHEKVLSRDMTLNAISEEGTIFSIDTLQTRSNENIHKSVESLEYGIPLSEIATQDYTVDIAQEQEGFAPFYSAVMVTEKHLKNKDKVLVPKDSFSRKRTMFESSIDYIIDFLSCSSPKLKSEETSGNNDEAAAKEIENQLIKNLQSCIETNIQNLMGCSSKGAQSLIDSFGPTCNNCYCPMKKEDSSYLDPNINDSDLSNKVPKLRNRNVFGRHNASKRIQHLRQSGLSRHFSLAPVANYLAEEVNSVRIDGSNHVQSSKHSAMSFKGSTKDKNIKGNLIPRSQRPRSLGVKNRETSLGGSSNASYEMHIMATKSDEVPVYNKDKEGSFREIQGNAGALSRSRVDHGLLSRLFMIPSSNHSSNHSSNLLYQASSQDLYYDSDPGTCSGDKMLNVSELRQIHSTRNQKRGITIGIMSDVPSGQIGGNYTSNNKSVLRSLNIDLFDIHDSAAISLLIKELITDSFLLIWHPKKKLADWSASSNALPRRVKAWFEMGSCLKKRLLQPTFVWRANDQTAFSSRLLRIKSIQTPESIELLNIIKIFAPTEINRQMHPFVKLDCAFTLVGNDEEELLFETATKDERDKFIFAFKLMVARLASKIIVGDKDVFDEFFTPLAINKKKKKRKKRKRSSRKNKFNPKVIYMDELKEDAVSDTSSVGSANSRSFSRILVGSVQEESNRKDELWGI